MLEIQNPQILHPLCCIWIILAGLDSLVQSDPAAVKSCAPGEFSLGGERCCSRCPPGSGVQRPCSPLNDTACVPCKFGESFSSDHARDEPCTPCSICQEYSQAARSCNLTHDTACRCDRNYYRDKVSGKCRPCRFCPIEYGVSRECNRTHDRVCSRCSGGFYSDRLGTQPCKRCGICGMSQIMLQHCSPGQNTICIDIPTMRNTQYPVDGVTSSVDPSDAQQDHVNPIPIYCSILGVLVVVLIIYVIYKQNQRRQMLKNKNQSLSASASTECPPLLSGVSSSAGIISKHGSDSGVYVDQDRAVVAVTRIRDLPANKRKALENSMYGCREEQGGWRSLAKELGFSNPVISSIETRAHQEGFSPVRILLTEWGKRDNALVGTLIHALRAIHRDDCVRILLGENREYLPPPKYVDIGSMHSQII